MFLLIELSLVLIDSALKVQFQLGIMLREGNVSKVYRKEYCNDSTNKSNDTTDEEDGGCINFSKGNGCEEGAGFAQESTHAVKSTTQLGRVSLCCDLQER